MYIAHLRILNIQYTVVYSMHSCLAQTVLCKTLLMEAWQWIKNVNPSETPIQSCSFLTISDYLFRPKGQHGPVCRVMQNSEWKNWLFFTSCECNKSWIPEVKIPFIFSKRDLRFLTITYKPLKNRHSLRSEVGNQRFCRGFVEKLHYPWFCKVSTRIKTMKNLAK